MKNKKKPLRLYNTLTRKKAAFKPLAPKNVSMYSCGPTVYNFAHIGNMRTYIFTDLLRRALSLNGYKIKGVLNITDVGHLMSDADEGEDKMARAAREQKKSPEEIASFYTGAFLNDLEKLNVGLPEIMPRATEHIREMTDYCDALYEKGYAYETEDGLYFDISKFPKYGKLSRAKVKARRAGARVRVNSTKRNAADFALWKKAEPGHIMQWDSRWGRGYPGWHIECSAMSKKYLGARFDIHTGGVDHIPIHHENEIAQSEAREGDKTVNVWMHGEFMLVDNGKMSKSLGNTYTVSELESRGYSPLDFRYFCLGAHYRKKLNFTFTGMDGAKTAVSRMNALLRAHKTASAAAPAPDLSRYEESFNDAMNDDLNAPYALGVLWTMLKDEKRHPAVYAAALRMDKFFGLSMDKAEFAGAREAADIPEELLKKAALRDAARAARDFSSGDRLRAEIEAAGYTVTDGADGKGKLKKK